MAIRARWMMALMTLVSVEHVLAWEAPNRATPDETAVGVVLTDSKAPEPLPGGVSISGFSDPARVASETTGADPGREDAGPAGARDWCPGSGGNCCMNKGTPGCNDVGCCNEVCSDPPHSYCCSVGWDWDCAAYAITYCDSGACEDCPGEGDCCSANGTPACEVKSCCDLVCAYDSWCCDHEWNDACAGYAEILCPDLCNSGEVPDCPGEGDCCVANGTPGCDEECCCAVVCDADSSCCDVEWDGVCAGRAAQLCRGWCSPPFDECPGSGECFGVNTYTPGCEHAWCCNLVCAQDPFCCDDHWDGTCGGKAYQFCDCPEVLCPGDGGSCCEANGTRGCNDNGCCVAVCRRERDCCDFDGAWDEVCVQIAKVLCGVFGDLDNNGNVDLRDFASFQNCFTGSGTGPAADECACVNWDADDDVDLTDYAVFVSLFDPS